MCRYESTGSSLSRKIAFIHCIRQLPVDNQGSGCVGLSEIKKHFCFSILENDNFALQIHHDCSPIAEKWFVFSYFEAGLLPVDDYYFEQNLSANIFS